MKQSITSHKSSLQQIKLAILTLLITAGSIASLHAQDTAHAATTTPVGTSKIWGKVDGITIEGLVQGPSAVTTPLQVVCVFEYTEGDIYTTPPALPAALNGLVHLDHDLKGLLTDIRKNGYFHGHAFETMLITPPAGYIAGKQLLLIGLGNRTKFNAALMTSIGSVAMREALRLQVSGFAFASDLKDAGIDSPTALVAENVVKGLFEAYHAELYLQQKQMTTSASLTKITLLAGPSFFTVAGQGIQQAITTIQAQKQ